VNEWDTPTISILLSQTKIGKDMMTTIEKLGKIKSF